MKACIIKRRDKGVWDIVFINKEKKIADIWEVEDVLLFNNIEEFDLRVKNDRLLNEEYIELKEV